MCSGDLRDHAHACVCCISYPAINVVFACPVPAGLHHSFEKWKKPFNPILGETWEAGLPDGSSIFMEQISHHPPVSAFHLEGPGWSSRPYTMHNCMRHMGMGARPCCLRGWAGLGHTAVLLMHANELRLTNMLVSIHMPQAGRTASAVCHSHMCPS